MADDPLTVEIIRQAIDSLRQEQLRNWGHTNLVGHPKHVGHIKECQIGLDGDCLECRRAWSSLVRV